MSRRIKAIVEYDGSDFCGWQIQPQVCTIQGEIEKALAKVLTEDVRITAAGRTDAGVHALGQVISFTTEKAIPTQGIIRGANSHLPCSVRIVNASEVPDSFHPRKDAIFRWYRYSVLNRKTRPVINRNYLTFIPVDLDFEIINEAVNMFRGEHDFSGFRSADCESRRTMLNMKYFHVFRRRNLIVMDLGCRSFLYNMVRIITGGIFEAARGKIGLSVLEEMLASGVRNPFVPTAPPTGLVLMKVYYPGEEFRPPPEDIFFTSPEVD